MKSLLLKFPEYYLIILAILAGISPPFSINPIAIAIVSVLILQIIFKSKIFGLALGIIFLLVNIYMFGALISEFNEFTEFNASAKKLLFVGLSLWTLNMIAAITIIYKYATVNFKSNPKVEYNQ